MTKRVNKDFVDQLLDFDTILMADEAIELGLADGIYGTDSQD